MTNSGSFLSSCITCMFLHPRAVDLHKTDPVRQSLIGLVFRFGKT